MALMYSSVPVSQQEQYPDPETEAINQMTDFWVIGLYPENVVS